MSAAGWRRLRIIGVVLAVLIATAAVVVRPALLTLRALHHSRHHTSEPASGTNTSTAVVSRARSTAAQFVGSQACAGCHATQFKLWSGSHHELALQAASAQAVLAPFAGERMTRDSATTTFRRNGAKYLVSTQRPGETPHEVQVVYTMGVAPLQQYLVPGANGGLQVFDLAWDNRPRAAGGQRWFALAAAHDARTRAADANWNFMCADCHVTQFRKNFDVGQDRYASTWSEGDVGCEACHGPGSSHLHWAEHALSHDGSRADRGLEMILRERANVRWTINPESGNAERSAPADPLHPELEVCARCHSHRSQISDDYVFGNPLGDTHVATLLETGLYWPDGQMRGEVYNYGSFLQSRMYEHGVSCSDCHDPHSGKTRAPGNAVCAQCHALAKYDTAAHHFHTPGSAGGQCSACHMARATFMSIDVRHDHFVRVPRADLSASLGTPDACNACHGRESPGWAARATLRLWPDITQRQLPAALAFAAQQAARPEAQTRLAQLAGDATQSAIVRASAIQRLEPETFPLAQVPLTAALSDASPLVRRAAVDAFGGIEPAERSRLLTPLLADPVRDVRTEAARWLAPIPPAAGDDASHAALDRVLAEYVAIQHYNADRPEAYDNLGTLYADEGRWPEAEEALRHALQIDPARAVSAINLSDVLHRDGRELEARNLVAGVIAREPGNAVAHYVLGLADFRAKSTAQGLAQLHEALRLDPANGRYAYVYGVALASSTRYAQSVDVLQRAVQTHPNDADLQGALAASCRHIAAKPCAAPGG